MRLIGILISIAAINGYILDPSPEILNRPWAGRGQTIGIDAKIKNLVDAIVETQNQETTEYHPKFL